MSLPTIPGAWAAGREFKARNLGLLALGCVMVAAPATAQVNYAVSGNTAYVTSSPNASGALVINAAYNGYSVNSNDSFLSPWPACLWQRLPRRRLTTCGFRQPAWLT